MQVFPGSIALSDFRKQKIVEQLNKRGLSCLAIEARYVHLVNLTRDSAGSLGADQQHKLFQLLDYGHGIGSPTIQPSSAETARITIPRIGTISPWATKATDIAHRAGLENISRIERGVEWTFWLENDDSAGEPESLNDALVGVLFDPMVEDILDQPEAANALFDSVEPGQLQTVDILAGGMEALVEADKNSGFALSQPERQYLVQQYTAMGRNPTDVELMMFAQVNSEHCRHKIFNAGWKVNGEQKPMSLFDMIRTTHENNSKDTIVAYKDNATILAGSPGNRFQPAPYTGVFGYSHEQVHFTAKVESHNHPTAISPFAGASTGSGGEIRDEGATGRGGKPKAGLTGFSVSHLRLPGLDKPWEPEESRPARIASPLQIMTEGPIGAAAFNNEFGRPNISGYFRTFEQQFDGDDNSRHGYHKPIMLAGGLGNIRPQHVEKLRIPSAAPIVVLGGPAMLIGLGGGAASSVTSGSSSESLDFASVQRGNPEMQRRCQEVIDTCCAMGQDNPVLSIHDVGAGGLCNALPELVHDADRGGRFELRDILNDEPGMSPMQIWCNESQERYVLAVEPERFEEFEEICRREKCLYAMVGRASDDNRLRLTDRLFGKKQDNGNQLHPVDLSMDMLFGLPPKMERDVQSVDPALKPLTFEQTDPVVAWHQVMSYPAVADKTFLVTIGDRSVTGMIARDQMVGPWQVPVADVAVTTSGYQGHCGEAMSIGERTPLAVIDAPASGCMAVGEALTNLVATDLGDLTSVRLSANWMVAAGAPGHGAALYETVRQVAMELCPALDIAIPVGKDSMSMTTRWQEPGGEKQVVSPLSLVVTAFAAVSDCRKTLTPVCRLDQGETDLWLLDLGAGRNRMGGSVLAQVHCQMGQTTPQVDAVLLKAFLQQVLELNRQDRLLAYHDRSDGGLASVLAEMCFAGRCGMQIDLSSIDGNGLSILFNEELGAVLQTRRSERSSIEQSMSASGLVQVCHRIGEPVTGNRVVISFSESKWETTRTSLHQAWSEVTAAMQSLRDNPECAKQENDRILDQTDPGIHAELTFDPAEDVTAPFLNTGSRPRVAILREQGVNGQLEMAASFDRAGFEAVDVMMSDLAAGLTFDEFKGLAACGGFSYGDVLGAGGGWAKSILFNDPLRTRFEKFFKRDDTFALGVCNGCQMMAHLKPLIPGTGHWPEFVRNASEQYEARFVTVTIPESKSIVFRGMAGSCIGISVAHGEGRALFDNQDSISALEQAGQLAMQFVDNHHQVTSSYPLNPNGSPSGATGFTSEDGRFTIMMPHPERVFRTVTHSWHPDDWPEDSPWMRIFRNARVWIEQG